MLLFWIMACDPAAQQTEFTGVITMLEEVNLDAPTDDNDPTPERANTDSAEAEDYDIGYLRGWIKAPIEDVFVVITIPDVGVDRRQMESWSSTELQDDEVDAAYVTNNAPIAAPSEDFDLTWRHEFSGDDEAPTGSRAAWAKTAGTIFVPLLEGSAELIVEGDVVDFRAVYHLGTIDSSPEDAVRYLKDFYASILAVVHGGDLPTYD